MTCKIVRPQTCKKTFWLTYLQIHREIYEGCTRSWHPLLLIYILWIYNWKTISMDVVTQLVLSWVWFLMVTSSNSVTNSRKNLVPIEVYVVSKVLRVPLGLVEVRVSTEHWPYERIPHLSLSRTLKCSHKSHNYGINSTIQSDRIDSLEQNALIINEFYQLFYLIS